MISPIAKLSCRSRTSGSRDSGSAFASAITRSMWSLAMACDQTIKIICPICPHQSDCLKVGSCLDDINAPWSAKRLHPRLMTPAQANTFMERLQGGESVRRMTCGSKKVGKALATYNKYKNHCAAYPQWGAEAERIAKINAKAADILRSVNSAKRKQTQDPSEQGTPQGGSISVLLISIGCPSRAGRPASSVGEIRPYSGAKQDQTCRVWSVRAATRGQARQEAPGNNLISGPHALLHAEPKRQLQGWDAYREISAKAQPLVSTRADVANTALSNS